MEGSLLELCPLEDIKLLLGDCRPVDVSFCRLVSVLSVALDAVFGIVEWGGGVYSAGLGISFSKSAISIGLVGGNITPQVLSL
jgi:hypothetical protein